MEVDEMVKRWHRVVLGLAMAHDKDAADRHEAAVEECLQPILAAPVKQLREFAPKLLAALKGDPQCPFIIWRAYEVWVDMIKEAPNDGIKELKKDLARQIVEMVEEDVKPQVGEAMVRALMWRSPEALEKVKASVEKGNKPRLRGRESCLFLELGGTEQEPEVCVQL